MPLRPRARPCTAAYRARSAVRPGRRVNTQRRQKNNGGPKAAPVKFAARFWLGSGLAAAEKCCEPEQPRDKQCDRAGFGNGGTRASLYLGGTCANANLLGTGVVTENIVVEAQLQQCSVRWDGEGDGGDEALHESSAAIGNGCYRADGEREEHRPAGVGDRADKSLQEYAVGTGV